MSDHPKGRAFPFSPFRPPTFSKEGIKSDEEKDKRQEELIRRFRKGGVRIGEKGTIFGIPYSVDSARQGFLYFVTSRPAIQLSKEQRRMAANDPALEYDSVTFGYRRKRRQS